MLGNLANAWTNQQFGKPGEGNYYNLRTFDPQKLFKGISQGQFGKALRRATPEQCNRQLDFTAPKYESGTSFWGDLLTGFGSAFGGAGKSFNPFGKGIGAGAPTGINPSNLFGQGSPFKSLGKSTSNLFGQGFLPSFAQVGETPLSRIQRINR